MKFKKRPILKLSGVLHTFGGGWGGSHLGDWEIAEKSNNIEHINSIPDKTAEENQNEEIV